MGILESIASLATTTGHNFIALLTGKHIFVLTIAGKCAQALSVFHRLARKWRVSIHHGFCSVARNNGRQVSVPFSMRSLLECRGRAVYLTGLKFWC